MAARYAGPRNARVGVFRSGLEARNAKHMEQQGVAFTFEGFHINYVVPSREAKYNPDFLLQNNILVETKGLWDVADRQKHLLIREQYPMLDIRLVFSSSKTKLYSGSPTTYGMWCEKHGILYADKLIPLAWLKEATKVIPDGVLVRKKEK